MRKIVLVVSFMCLVLLNSATFADNLTDKNNLSVLNVTEINNLIVINKNEIAELEQANLKAKKELAKTDQQLETLNQIIFFYSDKNITNVFEAVENNIIESTPVLEFENTKCGYPIYNGAQKKMDKLIRLKTQIAEMIKINELTMANLKNKNHQLASQRNLLEQKLSYLDI